MQPLPKATKIAVQRLIPPPPSKHPRSFPGALVTQILRIEGVLAARRSLSSAFCLVSLPFSWCARLSWALFFGGPRTFQASRRPCKVR